jgi:hypothetical protein
MVALRQILVSAALACCATAPAAATAMIGVEPAASGLTRPDDGAHLRAAAPSDPTSDNLHRTMSQLPDAATWVLLVGGFSLIGLSLRGSHASGIRRVESFGAR